jgi:hypothetical protein
MIEEWDRGFILQGRRRERQKNGVVTYCNGDCIRKMELIGQSGNNQPFRYPKPSFFPLVLKNATENQRELDNILYQVKGPGSVGSVLSLNYDGLKSYASTTKVMCGNLEQDKTGGDRQHGKNMKP